MCNSGHKTLAGLDDEQRTIMRAVGVPKYHIPHQGPHYARSRCHDVCSSRCDRTTINVFLRTTIGYAGLLVIGRTANAKPTR
jgi:hypothetical protein